MTTSRRRRLHLHGSRRRRLLALPIAGAAAAIVLAACGGGTYGSGTGTAASQSAPSSAALAVRHTGLGTILTDAKGFTLYAFDADRGTRSTCSGACAAEWPPVTTTARSVTVSGGATRSLVGRTVRTGDVRQLTYAGHPLYRYAGDAGPGSTNGQGSLLFGARWEALAPTGAKVE